MAIIDTASTEANMVRMEDVLLTDYLAVPRVAMQIAGPAAQTLAAVMRQTKSKLFTKVETLADLAVLKTPTCRRHLDRLVRRDFLTRAGRQRRRTVTYEIPKHTKDMKSPYAILPRWACRDLPTWSQRAVFALLVSRHTLVQTIEDRGIGCAEDRRYYTIGQLAKDSGLARNSVIEARAELEARDLIELVDGEWVWLNLDRNICVPQSGSQRSQETPLESPRSEQSIDWTRFAFDALKAGALLRPTAQGDRQWILGTVFLKHTILNDQWFYGSLEAVRCAMERGPLQHGPMAYWKGVLRSKCNEMGVDFDQELTQSKIPREMMKDEFWKQPEPVS